MSESMFVERYRAVRERLRSARLRGEEEVERYQVELDALWAGMSETDRRTIRGVGDRQRKAAA